LLYQAFDIFSGQKYLKNKLFLVMKLKFLARRVGWDAVKKNKEQIS